MTDRPTVWDAFEVEKRRLVQDADVIPALCEGWGITSASLARLVALLEAHPTATAAAILKAWRDEQS